MKINQIFTTIALLTLSAMAGCSTSKPEAPKPIEGKLASFVEISASAPILVKGYGLVAGLQGTGSAECPPQIRNYLKQYILTKLPKNSSVTADQLLDSPNNAEVRIEGVIPANASKGDNFDLRITPVPGTQTTSLAGGRLYTSNLSYAAGTRIIATAQGPIFLEPNGIFNPTTGYILGGGTVNETYDLALALYKSDFRAANVIRNRINERFGDDIVTSSSAGIVHVRIPPKYARQKARFIAVLRELYLNETPQQEDSRAQQAITELGNSEKGFSAETALEAIGRSQGNRIASALTAEDPQVKFRAARCLLFMGNDTGLGILRQTALDTGSPHRLEAIEAIAIGAKRNDAIAILKQFLAESDMKVRLATYEQLRSLQDPAISTMTVAQDFEVDQVFSSGPKAIYAYQSGRPAIVIFSAPVRANPDIFIESTDGSVIVNAPKEANSISIIRKHPKRGSVMGPFKTGFNVMDIIGTLSSPPASEPEKDVRLGAGLPYYETVAILKMMCEKGAISAEFSLGPLPAFNSDNLMEKPAKDR